MNQGAHKVRTLWLSGILHAFTHLYQMALIPLYLLIQKDFKLAGVEEATLLVTMMGATYFLPSYLQGILADQMSRKKLLAVGLAINGLGFLCLGFSPNYTCAIVSVAIAGLGGSFYHPAATALLARLFPVKTGRALGLVAIGASVGFFIGPIYAGWRADVTGNWRQPVLEMGALGIIFSALFYRLAEETPSEPVETKAKIPHGKLFPTGSLWIIFLLMCVAFSLRDFAGSGMSSLASLFLQKAHNFNLRTTGLMISGIYLASAISNPLFGHLSDGGRVRWALALIFLSLVMMAIFPYVPKSWMFVVLGTYGFFFLASYPVVEASLMESVPDAVRGRVFGLYMTIIGLFGNLAHWVVGEMVKQLGPKASHPENYRPIFNTLATMLLLSLTGIPCLHLLRKREGLAPAPALRTSSSPTS